jgi:hypothetical protein
LSPFAQSLVLYYVLVTCWQLMGHRKICNEGRNGGLQFGPIICPRDLKTTVT